MFRPSPSASRLRPSRLLIFSAASAAALGAGYAVDRRANGSGVARTLRTLSTGLVVAVDYKLNFRSQSEDRQDRQDPDLQQHLRDLHARNAARLADLLLTNGGLYLKMGQAIAAQGAALPKEFRHAFARTLDDAPADPWPAVEAVIRAEFPGRPPEEVFGLIDPKARASASVAQVHWARLRDGREVAIKVQKRDVVRQIGWDLWAVRTTTRLFGWWLDLPLSGLADYVADQVRLETDFLVEARNGAEMRAHVEADPRLRGRVYVPIVYPDLTTGRVLTAEWIEGVRLYDRDTLTAPWLADPDHGSAGMGWGRDREPIPGADTDSGTGTDPDPDKDTIRQAQLDRERPGRADGQGPTSGLGLDRRDIMTIVIDLFSAQVFVWGAVHCDPHPANLLVRRRPDRLGPQIVLLDHGLYTHTTEAFRHQYARLWRAMLTRDDAEVLAVAEAWGIRAAPELLASSAALMRPRIRTGAGAGTPAEAETDGREEEEAAAEHRDFHRRATQAVREALADDSALPRELILIGRGLRIVQGLNRHLGSPVNRIRLMAEWADRSLYFSNTESSVSSSGRGWLSGRVRLAWRRVVFEMVLAATDLVFWAIRARDWVRALAPGGGGGGGGGGGDRTGWNGGGAGGMEEVLDRRMREAARDMGLELEEDIGFFDG